jgi:CDP-diacylglycerol--serine O-phosphatidyltransferase
MVSFGAAPALVMYEWALKGMGKLGWIAAFVYCAGAALRLARFNTNIDVVDKRYFQGLPSPMAAAFVAGLVWVFDDLGIDRELWLSVIAWLFTMYAGVTMVSNVPFYSFKEINLKKAVPFWAVAVSAAVLAVIALKPSVVLFLLVFGYGVSGYVLWFLGRRVRPAA